MPKVFALASMLAFVLAGIVVATRALPSAEANHVPGATYTGTHQGGGTVEFQVTQDGSGLSRFRATNIPGEPSCNFEESEVNFQTPPPITDHMFTYSPSSGLSFQGSFPAAGTTEGTLHAKRNAIPPFVPACESVDLNWTASTGTVITDTPAPTPTESATPTPSSTATLTSTSTPTGTETPTVTATASGTLLWGDLDCDRQVTTRDNQALLRKVLQQNPLSQTEPCPDIGSELPRP